MLYKETEYSSMYVHFRIQVAVKRFKRKDKSIE